MSFLPVKAKCDVELKPMSIAAAVVCIVCYVLI